MSQRDLIRHLERSGYRVVPNPGRSFRHFQVLDSNNRLIATLSKTPSDGRGLRNCLADLRRAGVDIPRK